MNMKKRLKVKNDLIFQKLFGRQDSKDSLVSLINSVLQFDEERKVEDVNVIEQQEELPVDISKVENQGKVDVVAKTKDGQSINVQLQIINRFNTDKKVLYNWSRLFCEGLDMGQANKTISINFLDFDFIESDNYHTVFHLTEDTNNHCKFTDLLEIHFIELSKFRKAKPDINRPLERWLLFIEPTSAEVLEMITYRDPGISKAEKLLESLSVDEEVLKLYELREKALSEEESKFSGAREEGKKEGIIEGLYLVARNMINAGMDIHTIKKVTGLKAEEIIALQTSMQNNNQPQAPQPPFNQF